ncbi:MAG: tetratricopeptide repeat protein, partial [Candidatus Acetothermia bacterium]
GEEDSQTQEQVDEYREKAVDYYMQAVENQRDSDPKLLENVVNLTRGSTEVDPEVHYQLATNLAEQKRYQRAITQFEQAIEKNSEYTEAYLGFGDVLSKLDNYSQAIEQYKKALELKEDDPQLLIKMGQAYLPDGQYSEARESFEKALELHEDNFGALKGLGDLAAEQGDYEKAIEYYTEALAQKDDTETKLSLGDAYLEAEQFDDAKETFKQLTVNSPYNGRAYLGLGKVYQAEGDSSRALSNYNDGLARSGDEKLREQLSKRIVELDPEDLGTRFTLAQSYQDQHIYDSAIEQYRTIIDRTDNETNLRDAFQGLGDSYMSKTDYKKAQEFYQKGLEHAGQARNKLPFYEGILEANESIHGEEELTENGLEALFQIGKIQVRQGETEEAREKLTRLQELDSEYQTEEVEELLSEIEPEVEETTTTVGD